MNLNQLTELEGQLRSWVPRPPSATLKQRIFAPRSTASHIFRQNGNAVERVLTTLRAAGGPWRLNWLAWVVPATAALVVFALLVGQRAHSSLSRTGASGAVLALVLSNQNASASLSAALSNEPLALLPQSLAATNLRTVTSTFSPRWLSTSTN